MSIAVASDAPVTPAPAPVIGAEAPTAIDIRGLVKRFGENTVLHEFDLTVRAGEFVALLGKSGSGKTTLLRILADLDEKSAGDVLVPANRTVVFQEPRLIPSKRAWQNVILGLPKRSNAARADAALAEVGLSRLRDAWPGILSGGEAQRVAVARAIVREPDLLLADEPFGALDALTRHDMQALLKRLHRQHGFTTLLVTHDVDEAVSLADRALVLTDGHISLDLRIDLPDAERHRSAAGFIQARDVLLQELGVDTDTY